MRIFNTDCYGNLNDHNGRIGTSDKPPIYYAVEILNKQAERIKELEEKIENCSYAYHDIEEYENIVGYPVNNAFKTGWIMARTTNSLIQSLKSG